MPLTAGARLGPYEILAALGAGGMGEVYQARDTKLNRSVAIKILPETIATDPERLARFHREAQLLASLNHPNIAAIYGFEDSSDVHALVMELVNGSTLADRIAAGPVPLEEALPIAKQIAEALEAAHEQGIVHRDLKPGNIKVRDDGTVKVLDFGLAKAIEPAGTASSSLSMSPTITTPAMTQAGVILGTAAYMSPEQAKGRTADKRTDVWAFGCVLYEMLTGRRAFDGEDVSDTMAAVLRAEPDWLALPSGLPSTIVALLRRCLVKDRQRRIADIAIVQFVLDEPSFASAAPTTPPGASRPVPWWRRAVPALVSSFVVGVLGVVAWTRKPAPPRPPAPVVRFSIVLPDGQQLGSRGLVGAALSPDGTRVAYESGFRLYTRSLGEMETRPISAAGTVGVGGPFFSSDGQWIGFFQAVERTLKRVAVTGGAAISICRVDGIPLSASWAGDQILFAQAGKGILHVSANGGEPQVLIGSKGPEVMDTPQLLDGAHAVLFTLTTEQGRDRWDKAQVVVHSLDSGQRKVIVRGGSAARYLPSGHLLYVVGTTVLAVPFDVKRLEIRGSPVPVVEGVMRPSGSGAANVAVSANGSLIYVPSLGSTNAPNTLALVSRDGKVQPLGLPAEPYRHPRISPDGRSLAFETDDGNERVVWVYGLSGSSPARRLTFGGRNWSPVWTPDGQRITFASDREGAAGVFEHAADGSGTAERLLKGDATGDWRPEAWTPDGKTLAIGANSGASNIWTFTRGDPQPKKIVESSANLRYAEFSRDGRWFAYSSSEAGTDFDIFIQPFPPTGAKYQLTTMGARTALWSPDGKQLFYADSPTGPGHLVAVDVRTHPTFSFGTPTRLPVGDRAVFVGSGRQYDVTPDGKAFVLVIDASASGGGTTRRPTSQINVVLNWLEELKQRVPTK